MTLTNSPSLAMRSHNEDVPDDLDPAARPKRRSFSAEQKLSILSEYEAASEPGAKGELLRREGIYSSHITEWRKARDAGSKSALGGPAKRPQAQQAEIEKLRRKNQRLEADLAKTRMALDIVGKAHALLEMLSESADNPEPK
jgi:transposase